MLFGLSRSCSLRSSDSRVRQWKQIAVSSYAQKETDSYLREPSINRNNGCICLTHVATNWIYENSSFFFMLPSLRLCRCVDGSISPTFLLLFRSSFSFWFFCFVSAKLFNLSIVRSGKSHFPFFFFLSSSNDVFLDAFVWQIAWIDPTFYVHIFYTYIVFTLDSSTNKWLILCESLIRPILFGSHLITFLWPCHYYDQTPTSNKWENLGQPQWQYQNMNKLRK